MERLPTEFGKGWMSKRASDLAQIAVVFGGFPAKEVRARLAIAGDPSRIMNAATVEKVLGEIYREFEEA